METPGAQELLHGTAVALAQRALLFTGKSGSGKSSLALEMMSRGATLVGDDRVLAKRSDQDAVLLSPPEVMDGVIEARGLGMLQTTPTSAFLVAVVDMDTVEGARLPEVHETVIAGVAFPLIRKVESPAFAAMLLAYLKGGRRDV